MSKGQIQSQIFIYILTIIVVGLLLYFGVGWIVKLMNQGEIVDATKFVTELRNEFDSLRPNYGSSRTITLTAPNVEMVCFVDSTIRPQPLSNYGVCRDGDEFYSPIICNAWGDNVSSVLFEPALQQSAEIGTIKIANPRYLCYNTARDRTMKVKLVSLGKIIQVSRG